MAIIRRPKATTTKGHYVTNAILLPEVLRAKELGKITDELATMFMMIAERYSLSAKFAKYSFRKDMVSFALLNLMANGLKFSADRLNPFAYYTTAIHNSFLQYMADEKKHRNIRDALILEMGSVASSNYMDEARAEFIRENGAYDEHGEIVQSGYDEFKRAPKTEKEEIKEDEIINEQDLAQLRMKAYADAKLAKSIQQEPTEESLVDYDD